MSSNTHRSSVIITGGATGIGFTTARAFAFANYDVALVDICTNTAIEAALSLSDEAGVKVIAVTADVSDPETSASAFNDILAQFKGPIHVLINNAGMMPPRKGWIEEIPYRDFQNMLDVHLGGAVIWSRLVLPGMREAQFGRIINMSSVNGVQPVPHRYAYVTAKKALRGLTEALALDCARAGITVNAIAPGYILTDTLKARIDQGFLDHGAIAERTPVGRWGKPEEIAHAALFLAAPESAYITGTTLQVDGGLPLRGDANENLDESPFTSSGR